MPTAHPLLPDLSATTEIDPVEVVLEDEGRTEDLATYRASADKCFRLVVGYIPPSKMTALRFELARMSRTARKAGDDDGHLSFAEAMVAIHREACRFGLKGWTIADPPFPSVTVEQGGRKVQVAADSLIDQLELRGWLFSVGNAVMEYNTLSDQKKRP